MRTTSRNTTDAGFKAEDSLILSTCCLFLPLYLSPFFPPHLFLVCFLFLSLVSNFPDEEVRCPLHPPFAFQAWYSSWNHSSPTFANWAAGTGDLESGSGRVPHALAEKEGHRLMESLEKSVGEQRGTVKQTKELSAQCLRVKSQGEIS